MPFGAFIEVVMILELKKTTDGTKHYIEETTDMIIAAPSGARKYMLFANNKNNVYAFAVNPEDIILIKDGNEFIFFRVGKVDENIFVYLGLIEAYNDLKKMPFEYREMALSLIQKEKTPQKACYFVGKNENNANSVAEKMIKKLIAYKSTTKQHKKELIQELIADLSAL